MPETISDRAQDILSATREGRIPDEAREVARETVARQREAYGKLSTMAKEGLKSMEEALATGYDNAKALNGKVLRNMVTNTEAAFDAATAMAGAKSLPEAAGIYTHFLQQQFTTMSQQTQEFLEISVNTAKTTAEEASAVAGRTVERARRAAGK